ncbi:MAG: 23S rRNA (pseudouridine(1915)-N(3))-methyltransferase RlmH [Candidatus Saccharimonadales bacterium]
MKTTTIFAIGKSKTEYHEDAIADYQKRLSRWTNLKWDVMPSSDIETESKKILGRLSTDVCVVLLDERGIEWSSPRVAEFIEDSQNNSIKDIAFIIGGPHGVTDELRDRADVVWSLSHLVFPHEMVRLIVAEQLYRAYDMLHGGSYHHK